jgi:hypothetical protein
VHILNYRKCKFSSKLQALVTSTTKEDTTDDSTSFKFFIFKDCDHERAQKLMDSDFLGICEFLKKHASSLLMQNIIEGFTALVLIVWPSHIAIILWLGYLVPPMIYKNVLLDVV